MNTPHTDVRPTARVSAERDFAIADVSLAAEGRRAIGLAEHEMPGLMAIREEYSPHQPLAGTRISGFLHMTVQTAVLIETLTALGAQVRWAGSNQVSTQDEAAAAVAAGPDGDRGVPVFAWKGQTRQDLWACARRALSWPGRRGPHLLLDDGAGLTLLIHHGVAFETGQGPVLGAYGLDPEALREIERAVAEEPGYWRTVAAGVEGVSEETTTGARHLHRLENVGALLFPAISVNDSVTKSKFDNRYGCRHSLIDGLNRATDALIGGKRAVVCGYGDVGKGCAEALRAQGARVTVTEIDPICALQATMDGYDVTTLDQVVEQADLFVTTTGVPNVITSDHMARMKHQSIVGNMGHFDAEIDVLGLTQRPGVTKVPVKPQVDEWVFPDGHSIVLLSEGRPLNLGNATGHPSFVMSSSFANQVLAQIELHTGDRARTMVTTLPKILDEKVARLHLTALGVELTTLTQEQSVDQGIPVGGPYKPEHYRY
ncbi:adenosylhomocysteinase [Streptomyces sp. ME19-01-6]|uniref:adenosylhomocysteinase n=1 Tax=Streptomyces sp. ME19-01-6 TaxID=3028686 RepID=UPI0029A144B5|nr:adenosylhomocysteinase [Streptomyces sp. ME19-01-6]MDX3230401.1 adenosylhomocysteinase [Streptomyces sp. ME19-01-6]